MGGGPPEEEEEHFPTAAVVAENPFEQPHYNGLYEESNTAENSTAERPVVKSMVSGGVFGFLLGSVFGYGAMVGGTAGAFVGASLASRDDALGDKTRRASLEISRLCRETTKAASTAFLEQPKVKEAHVSEKISSAIQTLFEVDEKFHVTYGLSTAGKFVVEKASPQVSKAASAVKHKVEDELDKRGYLPQAQNFVLQADSYTGFSRSIEAVKNELKTHQA